MRINDKEVPVLSEEELNQRYPSSWLDRMMGQFFAWKPSIAVQEGCGCSIRIGCCFSQFVLVLFVIWVAIKILMLIGAL